MKKWVENCDDVDWVSIGRGSGCVSKILQKRHLNRVIHVVGREVQGIRSAGKCFDIESHFRVGFGWSINELREGLEFVGKALDRFEPLRK